MGIRIAVVGTGTIGHLVGGFLSRGGHDVTVVSQFRRNATDVFTEKGITVHFGNSVFTTPVKATFWEDLGKDELFDAIMITGSADFTADAIEKMRGHAAPGAYWSSFQNGIPEDVIVPMVGRENVIPVVCYAGGRTPQVGIVTTHDGYFIIGEMDGSYTPRLKELAEILSCAKRVQVTDDIVSRRWEKLTMAVGLPARTVSGLDEYENRDIQICVARCAVEYYNVAQACKASPRDAIGMPFLQWPRFVNGAPEQDIEYLLDCTSRVFAPSKEELGDMAWLINPMELAGDLVPKDRLPMEGHHVAGFIMKKAAELGLRVPMYEYLYPLMFKVVRGNTEASPRLLEEAVKATDCCYKQPLG